jgi:membrane fusion protein (multidrug efflux system)
MKRSLAARFWPALAAPALLLLAACDDGPAAAAAAPPALPVSVLEVKSERLPIAIEAVGRAEGSREVEIRARVAGILEKRLYDEGTSVPAGKVLFVIDRSPYELAVQQASAALLQAQVRHELAQAEARRLEPLAAEKAISQRELDAAAASAREAAANIAGAEARLKEAQLNLSYTEVTAPIGGLTGRALRSEGSLVAPEQEAGLLTTITQVNPIWVRFSLAERDFERIRASTRGAEVLLVGDDGAVLADGGVLNFTGNTVDPRLGTIELRAQFANGQRRWLPGQFVKVRVLAGEQLAIKVPQSALIQGEGSRAVMLVGADGKAVARPVQIAAFHGSDAVVIGGLQPGDRVIVDNLIKARPGAPVQVKGAAPPPTGAPEAKPAPPKAG